MDLQWNRLISLLEEIRHFVFESSNDDVDCPKSFRRLSGQLFVPSEKRHRVVDENVIAKNSR